MLGYLHWTLLDNFEWIFGYGQQLGLHEVDRTTFERTPKPSADVYSAIVSPLPSQRRGRALQARHEQVWIRPLTVPPPW